MCDGKYLIRHHTRFYTTLWDEDEINIIKLREEYITCDFNPNLRVIIPNTLDGNHKYQVMYILNEATGPRNREACNTDNFVTIYKPNINFI